MDGFTTSTELYFRTSDGGRSTVGRSDGRGLSQASTCAWPRKVELVIVRVAPMHSERLVVAIFDLSNIKMMFAFPHGEDRMERLDILMSDSRMPCRLADTSNRA